MAGEKTKEQNIVNKITEKSESTFQINEKVKGLCPTSLVYKRINNFISRNRVYEIIISIKDMGYISYTIYP